MYRQNCSLCFRPQREGGGVYAFYGETSSAIFKSGTNIHHNVADSGKSIQITGGLIVYMLPAPAGHWLSSGMCEVYRFTCNTLPPLPSWGPGGLTGPSMNPEKYTSCKQPSVKAACKLDPDGTEHKNDVGWCPAMAFVQPCPWDTHPAFLGQRVFNLPPTPVDIDFPRSCSPGIWGSADELLQDGPECAGLCPAGVFESCSLRHTVTPCST